MRPDLARPRELRHVYWIGGGSGAGKSTIARRLAAQHGLRVYATDDVMADHVRRTPARHAPLLAGFAAMDMDQRWVERTPQEMTATFGWFAGEGFAAIVEDLLAVPSEQPMLVEGFRLLPRQVEPLLTDRRHGVWLLPSPAFRRAVFDGRGGPAWGFVARTRDPDRALRNLLERDALFTDRLAEEVRRLDLPAITVDGSADEDELAHRVAASFGLAP